MCHGWGLAPIEAIHIDDICIIIRYCFTPDISLCYVTTDFIRPIKKRSPPRTKFVDMDDHLQNLLLFHIILYSNVVIHKYVHELYDILQTASMKQSNFAKLMALCTRYWLLMSFVWHKRLRGLMHNVPVYPQSMLTFFRFDSCVVPMYVYWYYFLKD